MFLFRRNFNNLYPNREPSRVVSGFILSEDLLHDKFVVHRLGTALLLLLDLHEQLIRNNGLVVIGVEIPIHEAMVLNLGSAGTDGLLQQHAAGIFFVGEQLVDCLPIPFGLACW